MKYLSASIIMGAALAASCASSNGSFTLNQPSDTLTIVNINHAPKYAILPIEEEQPEAQVMLNGTPMDVRLAVNKVDYTVPFPLHAGAEHDSLVIKNLARNAVAWKHIKLADTFDTANREKFRPIYHHTPAYGWMNDANGLVYKDGEYHLYFQYNPYGSKWGNMHWGHSVSKDLVHWTHEQPAIARDTMGHIFSGSCVVDHNNTAGFGKDAIIAFYTSHKGLPGNHQRQQQCIAYSLDNGRTYTKYEGNPVVTPFDGLENFRDPKVFWYAPQNKWVMIVSADKNMRFYESKDLKKWSYMSEWGAGYGPQPNQFECPDFFEMAVDGNAQHKKWVMIVNINPGFVYGGSGTMYFVGQFDGHKFTCDTAPNDVKWLDWGKDHYATVTYSNTPGRIIAMPWMSNWQYANLTPTQQFRSQNALPRELKLYTADNGELLVSAAPVKETEALRNKATDLGSFEGEKQAKIDNEGAFELDFDLQAGTADKCGVEIANAKGEKVSIYYDVKAQRFVMDRAESGITEFGNKVEPHQLDNAQSLKRYKEVTVNYHNAFALGTWAPVPVKADTHHVQIFVDKSSVELFVDGGRIAMTNLVFPNEPYNQLRFFGGKVANAKAYNIK
ncbi:GH32 C-terminal domain-containing protein [Prevotellamassilia timonensis]|uniref:GH32 C-terminal domain-containing protein n=1 Tax=Prevotellamassilia timonensis TaxID=1852370 RepID=UPI004024D73D